MKTNGKNSGFGQSQLDGFTNLRANTLLWLQFAQLDGVPKKFRHLGSREGIQNNFFANQTMFDHQFNLRVALPDTSHSNWTTRIPDQTQEIHFQITLRVQPKEFKTGTTLELERFSKFDFGDRCGRQSLARQTGNQEREENSQNHFHTASLNPLPAWSVNFL
jgi:hypothetical protein